MPKRIRTAATSGVATRHLARGDGRTPGLIGAGALAVEHVRAMMIVRAIERVVVWSRSADTVVRFIEQVGRDFPDLAVEGTKSVEDAFATADIVCTLCSLIVERARERGVGREIDLNA